MVAKVEAKGNSSSALEYQIKDRATSDTYYYQLISYDNDGKSQKFAPISVSCEIQSESWSAFPIPAVNDITLEINSQNEDRKTIQIIDLSGRIVLSEAVDLISGSNQIHLDLSSLQEGNYFVRMQDGGSNFAPLRIMKRD